MASAYREGAYASEEGFQRFLDSIQARGIMYGSNEYSRDKLEDQVISIVLKEYDRYWKYVPGAFERWENVEDVREFVVDIVERVEAS